MNEATRLSAGTLRNYRDAHAAYARWCTSNALEERSLDAATRYVSERAQSVSLGTLVIDRAAIRHHHRSSVGPNPMRTQAFAEVFASVTKNMPRAMTPKKAATRDITRLMLDACQPTPTGIRNRAIIAVLFATGMRRGELAAMTWEDVTFTDAGNVVFEIRRSKTDQAGVGRSVSMSSSADSFCPVTALSSWKELSRRTGPLFTSLSMRNRLGALSSASIGIIVKEAAAAAGFDPKEFGGHSMRRGFATAAYDERSSDATMMSVLQTVQSKTGHKTCAGAYSYVETTPHDDEGPLDEGLL